MKRYLLVGLLVLIFALLLTACEAPSPATSVATSLPPLPPTVTPTITPTPVLRPASAVITVDNAGQLTELARLGKGTTDNVAWSPDGKLIAVASSLGIYFYDAQTWQQTRFIETSSWVHDVAFSPDGSTLASGDQDGKVTLRSIPNMQEVVTLALGDGWTTCVAFSTDGHYLAAGSSEMLVRVWDLSENNQLFFLSAHRIPYLMLLSRLTGVHWLLHQTVVYKY